MSKKKICSFLIFGLIISGLIYFFINNKNDVTYRIIKVLESQGDVSLYRDNFGKLDIYEDMRLESNDKLIVANDSYVYLSLDDDKYIYVDENSEILISVTGDKQHSKTKVSIIRGNVVSEIQKPLTPKSKYEIATPNSTMSVRGTVFSVDVKYDQYNESYTKLAVFGGEVSSVLVSPDGHTSQELFVPTNYEVLIHGDEEKSEYVLRGLDYDGSISKEIYPINTDELSEHIVKVLLFNVNDKQLSELDISRETLENLYQQKKQEHLHLEKQEVVHLYYYNEQNQLEQDEEYIFNDLVTLKPKAKQGYQFEGWYLDQNFTTKANTPFLIKEDTTVYPKYINAESINYKTFYYEEQLDGSYELVYKTSNIGLPNQKVNAKINEKVGFKIDYSQSLTTLVLKQSNENILKVYYSREVIPYRVDDKEYVGKYGEMITFPIPNKIGYDFIGYYDQGELLENRVNLMNSFTAKSVYKPKNNIGYKVNIYQESMDGDKQFINSITHYGVADSTVEYFPNLVTGFTPQKNKYITKINSDGSTVFDVYYQRNVIAYSIDGKQYSAKYGENIVLPIPKKVGYTFLGYYDQLGNQIENSFEIYESFDAYSKFIPKNDVHYSINVYYQNVHGNYEFKESKINQGIADSYITYTPEKKEGFTPDSKTYSSKLEADGSTVLNVYYQRHKIKYYIDDQVYEDFYQKEITLNPKEKLGYNFIGYFDRMDDTGNKYEKFILTSELKLFSIFIPANVKYQVHIYTENIENSSFDFVGTKTLEAKADSRIEYKVELKDGFEPLQSTYDLYIHPDGSSYIDVYYTRNKISYTVDGKDFLGKYG